MHLLSTSQCTTCLGVWFSGLQHTCTAIQPSPPFVSRILLILQSETLCPLTRAPQLTSWPPANTTLLPVQELDCSRHLASLIQFEFIFLYGLRSTGTVLGRARGHLLKPPNHQRTEASLPEPWLPGSRGTAGGLCPLPEDAVPRDSAEESCACPTLTKRQECTSKTEASLPPLPQSPGRVCLLSGRQAHQEEAEPRLSSFLPRT